MTDRLSGTGDIHLDLVIGNFSAEILHRAAAIRDIPSGSDSRRFFRFSLRRRSWSLSRSSSARSRCWRWAWHWNGVHLAKLTANLLQGFFEFFSEIFPGPSRLRQLIAVEFL